MTHPGWFLTLPWLFSLSSPFSPPGPLLFHSLPFTPWPYFLLSASPGLLPPSQTKFSLSLSLDPLPPSSHFENAYPPNIFILDLLPIYCLYCPWTRYIHNAILHQIALMTPRHAFLVSSMLMLPDAHGTSPFACSAAPQTQPVQMRLIILLPKSALAPGSLTQ